MYNNKLSHCVHIEIVNNLKSYMKKSDSSKSDCHDSSLCLWSVYVWMVLLAITMITGFPSSAEGH